MVEFRPMFSPFFWGKPSSLYFLVPPTLLIRLLYCSAFLWFFFVSYIAHSLSFFTHLLFSVFFLPTQPHCSLFLRSPSSKTPVSICYVWAHLHGWRKGKESRGLLWIIHAATVEHQSSWDPPDAYPQDSSLLSRLLLFTCTLPIFYLFILLFVVFIHFSNST